MSRRQCYINTAGSAVYKQSLSDPTKLLNTQGNSKSCCFPPQPLLATEVGIFSVAFKKSKRLIQSIAEI